MAVEKLGFQAGLSWILIQRVSRGWPSHTAKPFRGGQAVGRRSAKLTNRLVSATVLCWLAFPYTFRIGLRRTRDLSTVMNNNWVAYWPFTPLHFTCDRSYLDIWIGVDHVVFKSRYHSKESLRSYSASLVITIIYSLAVDRSSPAALIIGSGRHVKVAERS